MPMILDELLVENFGPYGLAQRITLAPGCDRPVILIGALNGAGKTTFLDALQLAMYGRFATCSNRGSLGYDVFLRRSMHHGADPDIGARVEVEFRHTIGGKERIYRVCRSWTETGPTAREQLEVRVDGKVDRVLTETWDTYVETFLPRRIAPLFFFDGEKIEGFADPKRSAELLSTAIHSLLGVDVVEQLGADLVVLERRKRTPPDDPEQRRRIERAGEEVGRAQERYASAHQERASAQNEVDRKRMALAELENQFRREGGELFEQREALEQQRETADGELRGAKANLVEIASGIAPLLLVLPDLEAVLRQAEREEASSRAAMLNEALDVRDRDLLRHAASNGAPPEAIAGIEQYLADDRSRRAAEAAGDRYLGISPGSLDHLRTLLSGELVAPERAHISGALTHARASQAQLDEADRKLALIPEADQVAGLSERVHEARAIYHEARARLETADDALRRADHDRTAAQKRYDDLHRAGAELRIERETSDRIVTHSRRVRETLQRFRAALVGRHLAEIEAAILDSLRALLRKDSLVTGLEIDPNTRAIRLKSGEGNTIHPDRLSAGERQLLAVAILWGLARVSGRTLPVVIDTPLSRLDSAHRQNLVERYFPRASHQVILLSTDEEVDARFYDALAPVLAHEYTLKFDEELGSTVVLAGYFVTEADTHVH